MKIVMHVITGLNDGGAESVLYRLCTANNPKMYHVISMMGPGKYGPLLEASGVRVTCLNMSSGRISFSGLFKLYRLFKVENPTVVQTWMYHADLIGGLIARLSGINNVFWNIRHSELQPGKSKRSTILVAKACAYLSRWVPKKIVCCAEKSKQVHIDYGYDQSKMIVINNGYNLEKFKPDVIARAHIRAELKLPDDVVFLGMVGRFNIQKNHEGLLVSLKLLKKNGVYFKCALVGAGMNHVNSELNAWIEEQGLVSDVLLLDQRTDIPSIMNALDIHIFSSTFGEGFPNVLAEAMACGTPCVSTDVGDAVQIVGNTGWIVPVNDSEAFANALLSAAYERSERYIYWRERSIAAIERIQSNFSLNKMVEAYIDIWEL